MRWSRDAFLLGLAAFLGALASSCVAEVRPSVQQASEVEQPTYLAQAPVADCKPSDSSRVCCIKKSPLTAVESCGATAAEVAQVLNGVRVLSEAVQSEVDESSGADGAKEAATQTDDPDDGWKQHCMDTYVACKNQKGWVGDCYACFRYCEGQHQWPFHLCSRKGKVR